MFKALVAITTSFVCLTGFQVPAKAASTNWADCFWLNSQEIVSTIPCRFKPLLGKGGTDQWQIQWGDGKSDIYTNIGYGEAIDSTGTIWKISHSTYEGQFFIVHESTKNGTIVYAQIK